MKISMDKKYRTRDGRDVRLLCVDGPEGEFPVVGFISGNLGTSNWHENGAFSTINHPLDLIEYHEPDIRTIWVNVYEDGSVSAYREEFSAQQAFDNNARPHVVIAQPVTFEVKK